MINQTGHRNTLVLEKLIFFVLSILILNCKDADVEKKMVINKSSKPNIVF